MTWILLGVGLLLTAGTAIFVASEFSLVALDKHTVEKAVARGDKGARGVMNALTHLSTNLSGAQVGITITTLIFGFAVKDPLTEVLSSLLAFTGMEASLVATTALTLAMVLSYGFSVVFGELIPKNLAIAAPFETAKIVAPLQHGFTIALKPLIMMFNATANFFLRLLGVEPQEELSAARSPAELDSLVRHSAQAGTLDEGTAILLSRTLQLADRTAADVMTHRGAMISIDMSEPASEVLALTADSGKSRFPVTDESEDDVVGIVQARQAIKLPRSARSSTSVKEIMSEVVRVPETVGLDSLLEGLRAQGAQLAVVIDEYGGTAGIVTLEDVIEEIVGEVSDEHDTDEP
ncbi:MAG: hemolysin family protein, partial [Dermabacter sp.]|nr:hemolysin family protein [Dermabacter sp.]